MKNCYIFSRELLGELCAKFKDAGVFEVKFSPDELRAIKAGSDKEVFLALIARFEKFCAQHDFVIAIGCESVGLLGRTELNLKIAKNLNTPIFERENLAALRAMCQNSKLIITDSTDEVCLAQQNIITPYRFEYELLARARAANKRVVLPESHDERVLKAAEILARQGAVKPILLGERAKILNRASELGLNLDEIECIDLENNAYSSDFAVKIYEARKAKGMSEQQAESLSRDYTYFGTMMVSEGLADAMVSGASTTTAATIRPALQIIKTKPNVKIVSGLFFMVLDEEILAYADCAITPNPTAEELAGIAVTSAQTAASFGLEPRVALLSYSTADSGSGPDVDLVREAGEIARQMQPNLKLAAPIQYDAAIDPTVGAKKLPNSDVAGRANVFIFPNLSCGNICYKAVQRSANALAVGPILQGLKNPVNDLSRGCLVEDIVNTVLISAIQANN